MKPVVEQVSNNTYYYFSPKSQDSTNHKTDPSLTVTIYVDVKVSTNKGDLN